MKLLEIVAEQAILPDLRATERDEVIGELIDAIVAAGAADPAIRDDLVARVLQREAAGSTGFGRGVAVPHVKHPDATRMAAAIGLSRGGVDFNSLDQQPVYSVFLLVSPLDRPEEHLQAMEVIFKNLSKDTFRRFLRQAESVQDVLALLEEADNQQLA
jgi:mannitol/fructose-specific phosphotransferase system IIA component (Ntr-type)